MYLYERRRQLAPIWAVQYAQRMGIEYSSITSFPNSSIRSAAALLDGDKRLTISPESRSSRMRPVRSMSF